jgi:hypothetical protein
MPAIYLTQVYVYTMIYMASLMIVRKATKPNIGCEGLRSGSQGCRVQTL